MHGRGAISSNSQVCRIVLQVQAWDAHGNELVAPEIASQLEFYGSKVTGTFTSSRGTHKEETISFGQGLDIEAFPYDSLFVGTFSPTLAAEWRVHLVVNGQEVHDERWPSMTLSPGKLDARGCSVGGLGESFMRRAGYHYKIPVVPGDLFGNELTPDRPEMASACTVSMRLKGSAQHPVNVAKAIDMKLMFHEVDNAWYLEFEPRVSGTYIAEIQILGETIPTSPLLVPSPPLPCRFCRGSHTAGLTGCQLPSCLDFLCVSQTVADETAHCLPQIGVYPDFAQANASSLSGECSSLGVAAVGMNNTITIVAKDRFGNAAWHGSAPFYVDLRDMSGRQVEDTFVALRNLDNGNYSIVYSVPSQGNYEMTVTLQDEHVLQSPLAITAVLAEEGSVAFPEHSVAILPSQLVSGSDDKPPTAGEPLDVILLLRDEDCLPLPAGTDAGDLEYVLQLSSQGVSEPLLEVLSVETGQTPAAGPRNAVVARGIPTTAGHFEATVAVRLGDSDRLLYLMPAQGFSWPGVLEISPASPDPLRSSLALRHLPSDSRARSLNTHTTMNRTVFVVAGTQLQVEILLHDRFGNALGAKHAESYTDQLALYSRSVEDGRQDDGTVNATGTGGSITVTIAGAAALQASLNSAALGGGDGASGGLSLTVLPANAASGKATAFGNASMAVPLEDGHILLQLRDRFGNAARLPASWTCVADISASPPSHTETAASRSSSTADDSPILGCTGNIVSGIIDVHYNYTIPGAYLVRVGVAAPSPEPGTEDDGRDGAPMSTEYWMDLYDLPIKVVEALQYEPLRLPLHPGETPVILEEFPGRVEPPEGSDHSNTSTVILADGFKPSAGDGASGGSSSAEEEGINAAGEDTSPEGIIPGMSPAAGIAVIAGVATAVLLCVALFGVWLFQRRRRANSWQHMSGEHGRAPPHGGAFGRGTGQHSGTDAEEAPHQGVYSKYKHVDDPITSKLGGVVSALPFLNEKQSLVEMSQGGALSSESAAKSRTSTGDVPGFVAATKGDRLSGVTASISGIRSAHDSSIPSKPSSPSSNPPPTDQRVVPPVLLAPMQPPLQGKASTPVAIPAAPSVPVSTVGMAGRADEDKPAAPQFLVLDDSSKIKADDHLVLDSPPSATMRQPGQGDEGPGSVPVLDQMSPIQDFKADEGHQQASSVLLTRQSSLVRKSFQEPPSPQRHSSDSNSSEAQGPLPVTKDPRAEHHRGISDLPSVKVSSSVSVEGLSGESAKKLPASWWSKLSPDPTPENLAALSAMPPEVPAPPRRLQSLDPHQEQQALKRLPSIERSDSQSHAVSRPTSGPQMPDASDFLFRDSFSPGPSPISGFSQGSHTNEYAAGAVLEPARHLPLHASGRSSSYDSSRSDERSPDFALPAVPGNTELEALAMTQQQAVMPVRHGSDLTSGYCDIALDTTGMDTPFPVMDMLGQTGGSGAPTTNHEGGISGAERFQRSVSAVEQSSGGNPAAMHLPGSHPGLQGGNRAMPRTYSNSASKWGHSSGIPLEEQKPMGDAEAGAVDASLRRSVSHK